MKFVVFAFLSSIFSSASAVNSQKNKYIANVHVVRREPPKGSRHLKGHLVTGGPHVVVDEHDGPIVGTVFEDMNENGVQDEGEPGIPLVMVSDSLNVVMTDVNGTYQLPMPTEEASMAGFSVFVTKPDGYETPVNEANIPQFYYHHKPQGSPMSLHGRPFRFGGLPPTGDLPLEINFPMIKTEPTPQFKIVVSGDPQTYSNNEIGYLRDSMIKELAAMDGLKAIMLEGDVMGDELSLYKRLREVVSLANAPQYYVPGNHDYDFDSPENIHSFDTYRREFGPQYYSFEIGDVHFIAMNDVYYPCTPDQNFDGLHSWCDPPGQYDYNGIITPTQMEWLKNDLAMVPMDKLIFFHVHIPIVSFIDQDLPKHMVDNVIELYETLGCVQSEDGVFHPQNCSRTVVAFGAHTHTNDNMLPGEHFAGFSTALNTENVTRAGGPLPFHQIVLGAACGSWWDGDFNDAVVPESYQRLGSPRGYWVFEFDGPSYMETFKVPEKPMERQMHSDILTPEFREWYTTLYEWMEGDVQDDSVPPVNINDLPDTKQVILGTENYLTTNVWAGTRKHVVEAWFDSGDLMVNMTRTQPGEGESILESLDVYALKRQMMVARHAYVSNSSNPRTQGYEQFRGSTRRGTPKPIGSGGWARQSLHVWQVMIPTEELGVGAHSVTVMATDQYNRTWKDTIAFEITEQRAAPFFQTEFFPVTP